MRILQMAYKSDITGGEMVLLDLVKGLIAAGHELHVIAPSEGPILGEAERLGAATAIIPYPKTYSFSASFKIAKYLKQHNIEIIQSHGMIPNIISRIAKTIARKAFHVSTEHLTMGLAEGGENMGFSDKRKAVYYRTLDNFTSWFSDRIICVSDTVRFDKIEQGINPGKLVTIPNGIDLERFDFLENIDRGDIRSHFGVPAEAPLVGTISRLSPQKDVATLLRAMPLVWEKFPETHCLLIGDGPEKERLEKLADEIHGDGRIIFAGYRSDALRILSTLEIFCLTSLWEGMPLVLLEAMACSLPIVCTPVGGSLEIVSADRSAIVVPFGNAEETASALCKLIDDPELRREMGREGRVRLERHGFTSDRVVQKTLEIFSDLINQSGS